MRLEVAKAYAEELVELLSPCCERIEIAGGIRRGKEEPHDIELVAIPKYTDTGDGFFEPLFSNALDNQIKIIIHNGGWDLTKTLDYGDPDKAGRKAPFSEKYYRLRYRGEKLDLFVVTPPAQWGTVFLIRTGDAEFSHGFVTRLWKYGLRSKDGHIETYEGMVMSTPEEQHAFELCHLPFIEPKDRTKDRLLEVG